ncbi:MAG: MerR family transcriptional regulator [Gammaproteobacteria bacterium]
MTDLEIVSGVLLDDVALTLDELACACSVRPDWIVDRVREGLLAGRTVPAAEWRFTSAELIRTQRLVYLEVHMDANREVAALAADLIEEVQRLRKMLAVVGPPPSRDAS